MTGATVHSETDLQDLRLFLKHTEHSTDVSVLSSVRTELPMWNSSNYIFSKQSLHQGSISERQRHTEKVYVQDNSRKLKLPCHNIC